MELRTYRVAPFLNIMQDRAHYFTDAQIVDMLDRAEAIGFRLDAPVSPLEQLTLAELHILTQDAGHC